MCKSHANMIYMIRAETFPKKKTRSYCTRGYNSIISSLNCKKALKKVKKISNCIAKSQKIKSLHICTIFIMCISLLLFFIRVYTRTELYNHHSAPSLWGKKVDIQHLEFNRGKNVYQHNHYYLTFRLSGKPLVWLLSLLRS